MEQGTVALRFRSCRARTSLARRHVLTPRAARTTHTAENPLVEVLAEHSAEEPARQNAVSPRRRLVEFFSVL